MRRVARPEAGGFNVSPAISGPSGRYVRTPVGRGALAPLLVRHRRRAGSAELGSGRVPARHTIVARRSPSSGEAVARPDERRPSGPQPNTSPRSRHRRPTRRRRATSPHRPPRAPTRPSSASSPATGPHRAGRRRADATAVAGFQQLGGLGVDRGPGHGAPAQTTSNAEYRCPRAPDGSRNVRRPGHPRRHRRRRHGRSAAARRRRGHRRADQRDRRRPRRGPACSTPTATSSRPGFIDIHTHYDAQVFWDPALTPSSWHGVTSVVAGNCGFSIAPCRPEHRELLARTLQHVEDMNLATLEAGIPWDFETFPEYLDSVEPPRHRPQLRRVRRPHRGAALRDGRRRLRARTRPTTSSPRCRPSSARPMDAGAMGFATSSSATHNGDGGRPVPCRLADLDELEALLAPLRELGKGVAALAPGRADQARRRLRAATHASAGRSRGPRCSRSRASRGTRRSSRTTTRPAPRAARCGRRSRAPAHVPDEPARAVHVQHGARVRGADGRARRGAPRRVPRSRVARPCDRGPRHEGDPPPELGRARGRRERDVPGARSTARSSSSRRSAAARRST